MKFIKIWQIPHIDKAVIFLYDSIELYCKIDYLYCLTAAIFQGSFHRLGPIRKDRYLCFQ
jgi:hypothetical protein